MRAAGFDTWTEETLKSNLSKVLPNGLLIAIYKPADQIVATAMAVRNPSNLDPSGGELGWLAGEASPETLLFHQEKPVHPQRLRPVRLVHGGHVEVEVVRKLHDAQVHGAVLLSADFARLEGL